jgi:hypothetical protein
MALEFLLETSDFEIEEMYSLQHIQSFFHSLPAAKAVRIINLIAEVTHRYQLEVIRPRIDKIIQVNQSPYDL